MTLPKAPRAVRTRAASVLLALLAATLAPRDASAHAVLVASTPAPGATVPPGPLAVTLHYNSRVDRTRSKVTLSCADATPERLSLDPAGPSDALLATATPAPGACTLRWQVLATDGHITRGDVAFTVAATPPAPTTARTAGN